MDTRCDVAAFEAALERLVLKSYADGLPVERTWEITIPITDAPNWTVTIEKTYGEETPSYRTDLLEE